MLDYRSFKQRIKSAFMFRRRARGISRHRYGRMLHMLVLVLSLVMAVPSWAAVTNYRLSDPTDLLIGDVLDYQVSLDSGRVVYLADQDADGIAELYSVPIDGSSSSVKLNDTLASGGDVVDFQISPDSSRVIYLADQDTDEVFELYSVPIDGSSSPVRINGALVSGGDVQTGFQMSQDSSRVVYRADQDTNEVFELYSVPIDGSSSPTKLNGALIGGSSVQSQFQLSPDSSWVVYLAMQDTYSVVELYVRPLDGSGSSTKISVGFVTGGSVGGDFRISPDSSRVVYRVGGGIIDPVDVYSYPLDGSGSSTMLNDNANYPDGDVESFQISPDSSRVVYVGDQDTDEVDELYSVPLDGSDDPVKLNGTLVGGGNVGSAFEISQDSNWVVYRADQDTNGVYELYSRALDGSGSVAKLNGSLVSGGDVQADFQISSDSSRVVYLADQDTDEEYELYSRPLDGGGSVVKLNGNLVSGGDVQADFQISPDSSRVVYRADQDADEVDEVFSVPLAGGTPDQLNSSLVTGGNVTSFRISPNGGRVVYLADQEFDQVYQAYSCATDGSGGPVRLNGDFGATPRDVTGFQTSPDSSLVVYRADGSTDEVYELYSRLLDGSGGVTKLSGSLVAGGNVQTDFQISQDSAWVIYRADQDVDEVYELYSVPPDRSTYPVQLSGTLVGGGDVTDFQISLDSSWVVYRADQDADEVYELYSVPIDGSASPVQLNDNLVSGGDVTGFRISSDSSRVVYRADQDADEVYELYSAPLAGGTQVQLNGNLVSGGDVQADFQISPDSAWVVYRADQDTSGVDELYSRPIDGSGNSTKLNDTLVPNGDVQLVFHISPDSSRALYRADQDTDGVVELYSAPIDGSGSPVTLSGSMVHGGDVQAAVQISPDSSWVVYLADQDDDTVYELYSRPLDGGGSSVKLNGPLLIANGDVNSDFQISPDSSRVVYRADSETDQAFQLYSRTLDGSGDPVELNENLASWAGVNGFRISPDSAWVVYHADQNSDNVFELFSRALDGSDTATRLSGSLVGGGDVQGVFQISLDSGRVVYQADQAVDDVVELYASVGPGGFSVFLPLVLKQ